jgi:hypothetical protein
VFAKLRDELFALGFTLGASAITIMTLSGTELGFDIHVPVPRTTLGRSIDQRRRRWIRT